MNANCLKLWMLSVTLVLLTGCSDKKSYGETAKKVNVTEAVAANSGGSVSFPGTTRSAEEVNVSFRISGPISKVMVKEGDYVRKGQEIATMDTRDYEVQLAATQAEYDQIKADAERVIAMYEEGTTTAQNYDMARYGLQQISQKLANHRNQLADTRLTSPVNGYVKEKLHEAGETVSAGMPVITVSSGERIEVEINVSARDYIRLENFSSFSCTIDALGEQKLPLERVWTSAMANATQLYTLRFAIVGDFDRQKLTPGMSTLVVAQFTEGNTTDVRIPSSAILNKDGHTSVFVYSPIANEAKKKDIVVKTLNHDGSATVEGLAAGDMVVSTGVRYLTDGQRVEAVEAPSQTNVGGML